MCNHLKKFKIVYKLVYTCMSAPQLDKNSAFKYLQTSIKFKTRTLKLDCKYNISIRRDVFTVLRKY